MREETAQETQVLRCDFCGEQAPRVRRIALDRNYERLQTKHQVQYACAPCSEDKERQRLGLLSG
jgi:DNA-directed RNA polymerase subunit RPC12/RpoP